MAPWHIWAHGTCGAMALWRYGSCCFWVFWPSSPLSSLGLMALCGPVALPLAPWHYGPLALELVALSSFGAMVLWPYDDIALCSLLASWPLDPMALWLPCSWTFLPRWPSVPMALWPYGRCTICTLRWPGHRQGLRSCCSLPIGSCAAHGARISR